MTTEAGYCVGLLRRVHYSRQVLRTTLATWPDGSPFLQLTDRAGQDRVVLRYTNVSATAAGEIIKRPGPSLLRSG